jgi:transposase
VLKVLYAIPSERKLCEHVAYNLLFRWFVGLPFSETMWDHSTFTKNRDRLLTRR